MMYKPVDFKPKDYMWYPEVVREIKKTAQKAAYMKTALNTAYLKCEPGEKKLELYQRLIEIQYIISEAWKTVHEWEEIGQFNKYNKSLEERYDLKYKSLKASLERIEKAYKELEKEEN